MISISVTGHRPDKLWGYDLNHHKYTVLKQIIMHDIVRIWWENEHHPTDTRIECISGMALGVDTIFAEAIIEMKSCHNMKLIAAVPCLNQDSRWCDVDRQRYAYILSKVDEIVHVSNKPYSNGCMQDRNQYMINRCDVLLAVYNGDKTGGTADAVKRAIQANKVIVSINPKEI